MDQQLEARNMTPTERLFKAYTKLSDAQKVSKSQTRLNWLKNALGAQPYSEEKTQRQRKREVRKLPKLEVTHRRSSSLAVQDPQIVS